MESRILFLGPVGCGKTRAIAEISDIETVSTDVRATDDVAQMKATTTVAMDMGVLNLDDGDRVVLYGAPGQDRFDFMWDILLDQSDGVMLMVNHSAPDPLKELAHYRKALRSRAGKPIPVVIGVTHLDMAPQLPFDIYQRYFEPYRSRCSCEMCNPPVLALDAREREDVRAALITMVAVLEMSQRFPSKGCAA